ncbi:hypothetical protein VTI74DRAFT_8283 [Chaetomium olivicolor]
MDEIRYEMPQIQGRKDGRVLAGLVGIKSQEEQHLGSRLTRFGGPVGQKKNDMSLMRKEARPPCVTEDASQLGGSPPHLVLLVSH